MTNKFLRSTQKQQLQAQQQHSETQQQHLETQQQHLETQQPPTIQEKPTIAERLMTEAMDRVKSIYPKQCFDWADKHPEYLDAINRASDQISKAYGAKDMPWYKRAVTEWEQAHYQLYRDYCNYCKQHGIECHLTDEDVRKLNEWFDRGKKGEKADGR